jgi:hypothetical protein
VSSTTGTSRPLTVTATTGVRSAAPSIGSRAAADRASPPRKRGQRRLPRCSRQDTRRSAGHAARMGRTSLSAALAGRLPRRGLIDRQPKLARERQIDHRWRDGNVEQRRKRAFPSQEDRDDYLVFDQSEVKAGFCGHKVHLKCRSSRVCRSFEDGASRARTGDLLGAMSAPRPPRWTDSVLLSHVRWAQMTSDSLSSVAPTVDRGRQLYASSIIGRCAPRYHLRAG